MEQTWTIGFFYVCNDIPFHSVVPLKHDAGSARIYRIAGSAESHLNLAESQLDTRRGQRMKTSSTITAQPWTPMDKSAAARLHV